MKIIAFLIALLGLAASCSAATNDDSLAAGQISKMRQEFKIAVANFNKQSKDWPKFKQKTVEDLLQSCSEQDRQIVFQYLVSHSITKAAPTFDDLLAQAFVIRSTASNNVPALTSLLAARCPEFIETCDVEFWLGYKIGPQGMYILASAYFRARMNYSYSSQVLLNSFIRAFPSLRRDSLIDGKTDGEFVRTCVQWIRENRASCVINYNYHPINSAFDEEQQVAPLFLLRKDNTNSIRQP